MEDNLVSDLVRFAASIIPGKDIPVSIHYQDMKSKVRSEAKAKSLSVEDSLEEVLKDKLQNIENESKNEQLEIGIELATVFISDRRFTE